VQRPVRRRLLAARLRRAAVRGAVRASASATRSSAACVGRSLMSMRWRCSPISAHQRQSSARNGSGSRIGSSANPPSRTGHERERP
jgi:hypothetical protein